MATVAILKLVDVLVGVRVSEDEEVVGLDLSQHSEVGYTFGDRGGTVSGAAPSSRPEVPAAPEPTRTVDLEARTSKLEVVRREDG